MLTSMSASPETIPFNAVDRYYLIPESDEPNSAHFPMLVCGGVELNQPLEHGSLMAAFKRINARFPAFRLGYELDIHEDCWRKVADLDTHFEQMVQTRPEVPLEIATAEAVRANIVPLSLPLEATIYGNQLTLRIHHSFADGNFGLKLLAHLIVAACDPDAYDHLPDIAMDYSLPIWRIVWDTPRQGMKMLWNWIRTFKSSVTDYKGTGEIVGYSPELIRNGAPVRVMRCTLPRSTMSAIGRIRREFSKPVPITLNTLIQVMIAHRLLELGILPPGRPVEYTQPIDLQRYKRDSVIYAGNLAGQVRLKITPHDLHTDSTEFQTQLEASLSAGLPLATLPSEWLLAATGRRFYKKINRDWLTSSIKTDGRFFVFSNLGILDGDFKPAQPFLAPHTQMALSGSLIGAPPLLVLLAILGGEGHLTFTYNPRVLNAAQIEKIAEAFSMEWLSQHQETVKNDAMVS